jgi:hypothetical protein
VHLNSHAVNPAPDLDDAVLASKRSDPAAVALLYQRHADRLYRYALERTGSPAVADDIVGDTMVAVLERLDQFDPARGISPPGCSHWPDRTLPITGGKTVSGERSCGTRRRATILMRYRGAVRAEPGTPPNCLDRPFDCVAAAASIGETVILVTTPDVQTPDGSIASPYASLEGMRALLQALRPR